ncbi:ExeA family protein [Reinekea marinisedimentorum]|uniref:MSHA biogenesis protein MshM n=1 Tax=Reinekea marinisedimentorum TaxID=230495 RepID=A0A4R3IB25_9GAMM|nr:AAA family ATPase [Reinekea marinisedimentorum]TCS43184.1 MSHA biogenesis protein MshM [Reinekea marinisedimentorum]
MYTDFFGFNQLPFSLSPDTGLFVNLPGHQRCFELMVHVLESGEGFLKVVGDVGTGKTILCRKLLRYLAENTENDYCSVYVPNPMLSPVGLYRAVGQELGLDLDQVQDDDALLSHITDRILALAESDKSVVIVVDEAQSLPEETLEALRLITNLETEQRKLVQIILFGQTELDTLLNQDRFRQVRQRITFAHYLKPLNEDEARQYLDYRLSRSGYNGQPIFSTKAIKQLHRYTNGVPRMINVLAHKALLAAFAEQSYVVTPGHIQLAYKDSNEPLPGGRSVPWLLVLSGLILAGAVAWRLL